VRERDGQKLRLLSSRVLLTTQLLLGLTESRGICGASGDSEGGSHLRAMWGTPLQINKHGMEKS